MSRPSWKKDLLLYSLLTVVSLLMFVALIGSPVLMIALVDDPIEVDEMLRVASPDQKLEALWLRSNAGATTAYAHTVVIIPKGAIEDENEREDIRDQSVLTGEHLSAGMEITWTGPNELSIQHSMERIFHLQNFYWVDDENPLGRMLKIDIEQVPKTSLK